MAVRRMWDAAFPPASPPAWEAVAGYIGGNTPHVWTDAEWARQKARWRLPIFTRSRGGDPAADARHATDWLTRHRVPKGAVVALDYETRVDAGYLRAFDAAVQRAGWRVMLYGSLSTVLRNPKPSGGYWVAQWTNVPHLYPGSAATQYGGDVTLGKPWDASLVADSTPLWDTRKQEDISIVDAATKQYLDGRFAELLSRVDRAVQRVGGRANAVYNDANPAFQDLVMAKEVLAALTAPSVAIQLDLSSATPEQMDQLAAAVARHLTTMSQEDQRAAGGAGS
jgi:hypothetical protein